MCGAPQAGECATEGSHAVALAETSRGLYVDSAAVCARLVEQPGGDCTPQVGIGRWVARGGIAGTVQRAGLSTHLPIYPLHHLSQAGHKHLWSCGLAAAANHSTTPNARLDRNPELPSLRRHFSGGPQQALPPVPVLRARRRIGRGEEITWTYPPEFIRRLQSVGAW